MAETDKINLASILYIFKKVDIILEFFFLFFIVPFDASAKALKLEMFYKWSHFQIQDFRVKQRNLMAPNVQSRSSFEQMTWKPANVLNGRMNTSIVWNQTWRLEASHKFRGTFKIRLKSIIKHTFLSLFLRHMTPSYDEDTCWMYNTGYTLRTENVIEGSY